MSLNNINDIQLKNVPVGNERRLVMLNDIMRNGTFLPKTIEYKDIDDEFKRWVSEDVKLVSDEGKTFPTMTLFSNQRFSEYSQSWYYTDTNNNLLLNFKSITRENNPQYGKIQSGLWNIPGERFYTMKQVLALDDNGTECLLRLKMKQPTAIDFIYKVSVFTNKYEKINEFNMRINKLFNARQCYIRVNGHYMPMTLENMSDESEYSIDDRQFYSQTCNIKVMGYIITENDYKVEEIPFKYGVNMFGTSMKNAGVDVEIDEIEGKYFNNIILRVDFPSLKNKTDFNIDTDFIVGDIITNNVTSKMAIFKNNSELSLDSGTLEFGENDNITIKIRKRNPNKYSAVVLTGINPNTARNINNLKKEMKYNESNKLSDIYHYMIKNNLTKLNDIE